MNHSYSDKACPACGDMEGCHIPGKVKRCRENPHRVPEGHTSGARVARYGQTYPKVVCLCGSTRFPEAWKKGMKDETLDGNIVLTVGLMGHAEGLDMDGPAKTMFDELHKRKIDMADEVLVLNVGGYVGKSTRGEIEYAIAHGKKVRYLEGAGGRED